MAQLGEMRGWRGGFAPASIQGLGIWQGEEWLCVTGHHSQAFLTLQLAQGACHLASSPDSCCISLCPTNPTPQAVSHCLCPSHPQHENKCSFSAPRTSASPPIPPPGHHNLGAAPKLGLSPEGQHCHDDNHIYRIISTLVHPVIDSTKCSKHII